VSVGILSLVLALTVPRPQVQWSGWVYFSLAVLVPTHNSIRRRQVRAAARAT
jgi:hypothetical protein